MYLGTEYYCCECGLRFDEPIEIEEDRGEHFGTPVREKLLVSPCCSADYNEIAVCSYCGREFSLGEEGHDDVCYECEEEMDSFDEGCDIE